MKAVWITRYGGPEVLQVRETPDPTPKPGWVRVRVKASGLNFAEVTARQGLYPDAPKAPCIVGYEAAGVIDALGEGVQERKAGDKVLFLCRFGGHADTVCIPERQAFLMPEGMTFEEAAALPVNYLTAYHMLFRVGNVRPGEKVLIHMAAGGVGISALQLCRTVKDLEIFGTCSASKHEIVKGYGCTHPIDYHTRDYVEEIKLLTDGKGVNLILDALGGADWKKGYDLLRPAGRLIVFGFANIKGESFSYLSLARQMLSTLPAWFSLHPIGLMNANKTVSGVNMGHLWGEVELLREEMTELLELYKAGTIKPHIDSIFPFSKAGEAHLRIESRKNVGKVLLVPE